MANGTIAFDTLSTSGQISGTAKSVDTDYLASGSAKAWLNYKGTSTNAINASLNTTSVTDNDTGDYTQNMTNNFSSANNSYTLSTQAEPGNEDNGMYSYLQTFASSTFRFGARTARNSAKTDVNFIFPKIHGDLA
tara:strand:+ start:1195 stop:1599 length:405 start_codon:yes stop_codon:yes gene_type:complete